MKYKTHYDKSRGRRAFLKNLAAGTIGAASAVISAPKLGGQQVDSSLPFRRKKGNMHYRRLGRTDLFISEISLGGSPLPSWDLFLQIIERGVNYIDTSCTYNNGNSERQIGRLFKEIGRDKIYMGTKFHLRGSWSEKTILESVEGSLQRLATDYIDVLLIHGAAEPDHLVDEQVIAAFEKLKKEGKYRFSGLSCHSNHHAVVTKAIECGRYDMIQMGYNVFDIDERQPAKEVEVYGDYLGDSGIGDILRFAAAKDVGLIAMKALKVGGRRQNLEKYRIGEISLFQAMLKWVLENRHVASVVIEMLNYEQMEEDLAVVGMDLTASERKSLLFYVAENGDRYCHACARCQRVCPAGISTTDILRILAYEEAYRKLETAKRRYAALDRKETKLACQDCGLCERACPYGVPVREKIERAHKLFTGTRT